MEKIIATQCSLTILSKNFSLERKILLLANKSFGKCFSIIG